MKRLVVIAVAAGAVLAVFLTPVAPATAQTAPAGFVRAPGGPFMTDSYGRVLQFHGFNLVPKCPSFSKIATSAPGQPCIPDVNHPGTPSYWLSPDPAYLAVDPERTFTDADAAALADLGFNFARVGLIWRALEPGKMATPAANDPGFCTPRAFGTVPLKPADDELDLTTLNAYLAHVDATINLLAAHGIYSLIDMHQDDYSEYFNNPASATPWEGEGAPLWAVCTFLTGTTTPAPSNSANAAKWSQDPVIDPALAMAADHFWSNDVSGNLQGQYIRMWQEVAKHYRDNRWIIGYDPFNEPYDSTATLTPTEFDSRLQCFYAGSADPDSRCNASLADPVSSGFIPSILDASVDPNHLVTYEAPVTTDYHGSQTVGVGVPLNYRNLVLNFHVYPPIGAFTGGECTSPACPTNDDLVVNNSLQIRAQTTTAQPGGPALLVSEFGAEDYNADLAYDANAFDGHLVTLGSSTVPVSWAYWSAFQNHDPTGQPNERLFTSARALVQPKGSTLARAYPRATAGTPVAGSQSFDPATAIFNYTYAPDHAVAAPTEVVLPRVHYGAGYVTQVSGAAVTSPCDAPVLTLVADAPATQVSVTVKPGTGCAAPVYVHSAASPCSAHNPCPTPNTSLPAPPLAPALVAAGALALAWRGRRSARAKLSTLHRRRTT